MQNNNNKSTGLRAFHERLIISAVRRAGSLSKAEIARTTGLSGQSATVIVNSLLEKELFVKCEKKRGHVGQPVTPIALNPQGAFSIGVKIGRRSLEILLADFCGDTVVSRHIPYRAPLPAQTMTMATEIALEFIGSMSSHLRDRIVGLGIAMPFVLHEWSGVLGLERESIAAWQEIDVAAVLESATGLPTSLYNDATAACAAEMIAGDRIDRRSALYIYHGTFIGGGVVIDGRLYRGDQLNAGALGSMPIDGKDAEGIHHQLIHQASVFSLEQALEGAGLDVSIMFDTADCSVQGEQVFSTWLDQATEPLARAVICAISVIDFESVVIDGLIRSDWCQRVVEAVTKEVFEFNRTGLSPIEISLGSIGPKARVLGAAMLPLIEKYSPDKELLIKNAEFTASKKQQSVGQRS